MKGSVTRKLISSLPKSLKYPIYRSQLNLPTEFPPELQFKIVSTKEELFQACSVLHDCYVQMNYSKEDPLGMRLTEYHLLPTTVTAVALWEGKIVGTMSVVRDNLMGLPMDKIFDLSPLRKNGKVLGEVSGLAIDPNFRGGKGFLFHHLIRYLWSYTKKWQGLDYYVLAVNPSMSDFYEAFYLFEPMTLGNVVDGYDFANGATAVALKMPVEDSYNIIGSTYKHKSEKNNLHSFMTKPALPGEIYPEKEYYTVSDNFLNQFSFKDIFHSVKDFETRFKESTLKSFSNVYGFQNFEDLVGGQKASRLRHETRAVSIVTPSAGEAPKVSLATVKDISRNGLKLVTNGPLQENYSLKVAIGPNKKANVVAEPMWVNQAGEVGLKIISSDNNWKSMHNTLDQKLLESVPESVKQHALKVLPELEHVVNKEKNEKHDKIA